MESNEIFEELNNAIRQLKQLQTKLLGANQEKASEIEKKESSLVIRIVGCFHEILLDNFIPNKKEQSKSPENKENNSYYWDFISKHFNTPVVFFCRMLEKGELNNNTINSINPYHQKGKSWIYFSILEKTFYDSINEIYKQGLDKIYYEKDSILRKEKKQIMNILNQLQEIQFINIKSKDFEKYLDFTKKNKSKSIIDEETPEFDLKVGQSPIIGQRSLNMGSRDSKMFFLNSNNRDMSSIIFQSEYIDNDNENDYNIFLHQENLEILDLSKGEEENGPKFDCKKYADFSPNIVDNFYSFNLKKDEDKKENEDEQNNLNLNSINDMLNDEEFNSSGKNEEELKCKSGLVLNPKISKFLPIDKLYKIDEKTLEKEYNKNDKLIYKKNKRTITNCLLLYLNKYYKKAPYHKFYKHNLHNRPITLKKQNYQCYICLKKFSLVFDIPVEEIFWCSYYMRFVCKNCIDDEYSIIPYFVLKKWCFEKFSISKKAKNILLKWYNKPIIYFKDYDKLVKKIPQLKKVIEVKKVINNIFNIMKCKNKFDFIDEKLGEYEYLALEGYLFSMKDLVEINNKKFYKKIVQFKNLFIKHISGECPDCLFEGQTCSKCGSEEKIFFYNTDNVYYCKECHISLHQKCLGLVGHVCKY